MFQAGAPSHPELFHWKPELAKHDGQLPPADLLKGFRAAFINPHSALLGPKYKFQPYGKAGIEMGELVPHIGQIADEICLVRSMQTDAVNHAPAQVLMNTGSQQFGRTPMVQGGQRRPRLPAHRRAWEYDKKHSRMTTGLDRPASMFSSPGLPHARRHAAAAS